MSNDTLTSFLREPKKLLKIVDKRDVVLDRRGKASIRISLESRNASADASHELASNLLADAVASLPEITARMPAILERRFPWMRFLPASDRDQFARELVDTIQAAAAVGKPSPIGDLISAWKATAGLHADPELAAQLKGSVEETPNRVRRP